MGAGLLVGGQLCYFMMNRSLNAATDSRKQKNSQKKQKLLDLERAQYEQKIAELQAKVDSQKLKITSLKAELKNSNPSNSSKPSQDLLQRAMDDITKQIKSQFSKVSDQIGKLQPKANIDFTADILDKVLSDFKAIKQETSHQQPSKVKNGERKNDPNVLIQQSIKHDLNITLERNSNLHKICITGGPCAGKTTALAMLQADLQ